MYLIRVYLPKTCTTIIFAKILDIGYLDLWEVAGPSRQGLGFIGFIGF